MNIESFNAIPGHGIEVKIEGKNILLGNKKLMIEKTIDITQFRKCIRSISIMKERHQCIWQ